MTNRGVVSDSGPKQPRWVPAFKSYIELDANSISELGILRKGRKKAIEETQKIRANPHGSPVLGFCAEPPII